MSVDEIKHLLNARPFNAFRLRVTDNVTIIVGSPDLVAINPFTNTIYVFTQETVYRLTPEHVVLSQSKE